MSDVKVPRLAESISEAVLVEWLKDEGAGVRVDEPIATLETDKAAVEIASPENGVLHHQRKIGDKVLVGDVIARIEAGAQAQANGGTSERGASAAPAAAPKKEAQASAAPAAKPAPAPAAPPAAAQTPATTAPARRGASVAPETAEHLSPAVRRLLEEHGLDPADIEPSGRGGRILKEDVLRHVERMQAQGKAAAPAAKPSSESEGAAAAEPVATPEPTGAAKAERAPAAPQPSPPATAPASPAASRTPPSPKPAPAPVRLEEGEDERVVPMSRIRQRIAERLVKAQQTAAILTTFNEIDMTEVLDLRARHKESFEKRHGVKLGFMSFFTRACVLALEEVPELNAEIRGTDIVYRRHVHMGVAVGTERGLVVPVIRDAERRSFPDLESEIVRLADRARAGTLTLDELSGGTFTISNGGVYGSLFSTPILNPPQSGILGMHKIEKRPIALNEAVVIRPMMYVALSYDHRIVDGEQAVTFLVHVKERLEDPERMLLDV